MVNEKPGFLTPKAIAKRMKSKGLQKLQWYCQMCEKQCPDQNGFNQHLTSESHNDQLLLFADNPDHYISSFSHAFKDSFLNLLKRQFGTKRVDANVVYQEYIQDKDHVHMNSTEWETLTDFIKWLGKEGLCVVDETEKGWFVTYIDRDWEAIKQQETLAKKEKMDPTDDECAQRFIEKQIQRAAALEKDKDVAQATELKREEGDESKVTFALGGTPAQRANDKSLPVTINALMMDREKARSGCGKSSSISQKRKTSALDDIIKHEEQMKEKKNRKDYWLHEGIVVKVVTKKLGEKYYKKKGVIKEVVDNYIAIVKMIETGDCIKLDQEHLETVIPALHKPVLIVNGAYRRSQAKLLELHDKDFSCSVSLSSGPLAERRVDGIAYEDLSKLHKDS